MRCGVFDIVTGLLPRGVRGDTTSRTDGLDLRGVDSAPVFDLVVDVGLFEASFSNRERTELRLGGDCGVAGLDPLVQWRCSWNEVP